MTTSLPAQTTARRFVGQNIMGTPAMKYAHVAHDVAQVQDRADHAVLQEFKWHWYWQALERASAATGKRDPWRAYPGLTKGLAAPIRGAQAVIWDTTIHQGGRRWDALLHDGRAGWSDDRWLRGVELHDRATRLAVVAAGTHFVVHGDNPASGVGHDIMWHQDLPHLDGFLSRLAAATPWPVLFELDANIDTKSRTWPKFRDLVHRHHGTFHGDLGVEYLFTIPGERAVIDVTHEWTIPTAQLFTDHEGRGITYRLSKGRR